jgi:hypothetical protein
LGTHQYTIQQTRHQQHQLTSIRGRYKTQRHLCAVAVAYIDELHPIWMLSFQHHFCLSWCACHGLFNKGLWIEALVAFDLQEGFVSFLAKRGGGSFRSEPSITLDALLHSQANTHCCPKKLVIHELVSVLFGSLDLECHHESCSTTTGVLELRSQGLWLPQDEGKMR